jgi:hypothetical protein
MFLTAQVVLVLHCHILSIATKGNSKLRTLFRRRVDLITKFVSAFAVICRQQLYEASQYSTQRKTWFRRKVDIIRPQLVNNWLLNKNKTLCDYV